MSNIGQNALNALDAIKVQHAEETARLEKQHSTALQTTTAAHRDAVVAIKLDHQAEIVALKAAAAKNDRLRELVKRYWVNQAEQDQLFVEIQKLLA
jgi:hypothetical protein